MVPDSPQKPELVSLKPSYTRLPARLIPLAGSGPDGRLLPASRASERGKSVGSRAHHEVKTTKRESRGYHEWKGIYQWFRQSSGRPLNAGHLPTTARNVVVGGLPETFVDCFGPGKLQFALGGTVRGQQFQSECEWCGAGNCNSIEWQDLDWGTVHNCRRYCKEQPGPFEFRWFARHSLFPHT